MSGTSLPPTAAQILTELGRHGALPTAGAVEIKSRAANPARRDRCTRRMFELWHRNAPWLQLTVGPGLGALHERSRAFAAACPSIACPVALWHRTEEWDVLGLEHFAGRSLEELVAAGELSPAQALAKAARVIAVLGSTREASDPESAERELNQLFSDLLALPVLGEQDKAILQAIVFPFIRTGALGARFPSRWSNGDLIARNILVDAAGDVRLIDYEFAARTHFPGDDRWRWRRFSRLPAEALALPLPPEDETGGGWLEALCLVRQMTLAWKFYNADLARPDVLSGLRQLMDLLARQSAGGSIILPLVARTAWAGSGVGVSAQLFWQTGSAAAEISSPRVAFADSGNTLLRFELPQVSGVLCLRLHPATEPGVVLIDRLILRVSGAPAALVERSEVIGWQGIRANSRVRIQSGAGALAVFTHDSTSCIDLPQVDVGPVAQHVVLEVHARFLGASADFIRCLDHVGNPGASPT